MLSCCYNDYCVAARGRARGARCSGYRSLRTGHVESAAGAQLRFHQLPRRQASGRHRQRHCSWSTNGEKNVPYTFLKFRLDVTQR